MKKFAEKYVSALLWTMGVLLISLLTLCVFIFFAFRADANARASSAILQRAELENTVNNLKEALDAGEERLSYHYAASAAEDAASAGEHEAAVLFRRMADTLLESSEKIPLIRQTLENYLMTGVIPEYAAQPDASSENEEEIQSVSAFHVENAVRCVNRLFGENNTLRQGRKSRNGELVFSCSNAYAVIDEKTGLPIEAAISLPPAEKRLDADACVNSAMRFLEDYFPREVAVNASVRNIAEDSLAGTFEITFVSRNREMSLAVRRDNGRVARVTAR